MGEVYPFYTSNINTKTGIKILEMLNKVKFTNELQVTNYIFYEFELRFKYK